MSTDRNLLFGILAVQAGFCTSQQLVAAMNAWTLAKERPLGDILLEHGFLKRDEHELIAALVIKQLEKHGGDVEKSLAALTPTPHVAVALRRLADADVQRSLAALSVPRDDPNPTRNFEAGSGGGAVRYRILRPHARGGLGEVFVARDEELGREVALKEIQLQHADDPNSRGRFVREAEVTGGLEHPGVVAVYGLGTYADGRPFYAMRFIQGDSLKEAIDRFHQGGKPDFAGGEFRQLLGRFVDVCQAIAYAHSRGVLHRDLKPGNIMLGKFGETLVVDWGLAKIVGTNDVESIGKTLDVGSDSGPTRTMQGEAIGTPAFMSPEQATGKLDELGPATDVYSLGATLYVLLANRVPIEAGRVAEMLRKVERGEWRPLRVVNPAIPVPLAAICSKAMALKPADRYESAGALAADVEGYLADEPVSAHYDAFVVRVGRWARRHRTAVAAAAVALVVAAVAMGVGLVVVGERNAKLADAKRDVDEKRKRAEAATKLADDRFIVALDAIQTLVFEVQESLKHRPGMKPVREAMLKHAKTKLEQLTKATEQGAAGHALFGIHATLGDIALRIDGRPARATTEYERARGIAESLVQADPSDPRALRDLWSSLHKLGDAAMGQGNVAAARKLHEEALEVGRRRVDDDPSDEQAQYDLAVSLETLGDVSAARTLYERAQIGFRRLAEADPSDARAHRVLWRSLHKLGDAARRQEDMTGALGYYGQALEVSRRLAGSDPGDPQATRDLAVSLERLGDVARRLGDSAGARRYYEQAVEIRQRLAEADASDAQAQRELVVTRYRQGLVEDSEGNFEGAAEHYRSAIGAAVKHPNQEYFAKELGLLRALVKRAELMPKVMADPRHTLALASDNRDDALFKRLQLLSRRGDAPGVRATAATYDEALKKDPNDPRLCYSAACAWALAWRATNAEKRLPDGERNRTLAECKANALDRLQATVKVGYNRTTEIESDADLAELRTWPEYADILAGVHANAAKNASPTPTRSNTDQ
jgi:tetratricopeptide (TPR) repeat protein/tRNA A-37 threonylcarbamoyl transferase component Bud32